MRRSGSEGSGGGKVGRRGEKGGLMEADGIVDFSKEVEARVAVVKWECW